MSTPRLVALTALLSLPAAPLWAQADEPAAPPTPVEPAVAPAPAAPVEEALEQDESIYVVQRRVYSKKGAFELTPLFYTSLNNKFVGHFGLGLAAAYHVRENLALELQSSVPYVGDRFFSALVYEVYQQEQLTPEAVDLKQMDYFGGLSVLFSALYGKMELYSWLIDYDFFVTAGVGFVSTIETCVPERGDCSEEVGGTGQGIGRGVHSPEEAGDRFKLSGNLGGGMRFFFSDRLGLRLEIRDVVYSDRAVESNEVTTDIRNNVLFFLGLSVLL